MMKGLIFEYVCLEVGEWVFLVVWWVVCVWVFVEVSLLWVLKIDDVWYVEVGVLEMIEGEGEEL